MSPSASDLHTIATSFLDAFKSLSSTAHIALRAPECLYTWAPSSISLPAPQNNATYAEHMDQNFKTIMNSCPVSVKEIRVSEEARQITIWATAKPEFKDEAMGSDSKEEWEYVGEYIFLLDVNEDGRITRVVEFVDTLASTRFVPLVMKARQNMGLDQKVL